MQNKNMVFMLYNLTMLYHDTKYIITVIKHQYYIFFKTTVR